MHQAVAAAEADATHTEVNPTYVGYADLHIVTYTDAVLMYISLDSLTIHISA